PCPQRPQTLLRPPTVDADARRPNQPLPLEVVNRPPPAVVAGPGVLPNVELQQIDPWQPEVRETLFGTRADVVGRKNVIESGPAAGRPLPVFRWDFRRHVQRLAGIRAHKFPEYSLASAIAVSQCRVEEVAAAVHGDLQCFPRARGIRPAPAGEAPHAVAHGADLPPGPAEGVGAHRDSPFTWRAIWTPTAATSAPV